MSPALPAYIACPKPDMGVLAVAGIAPLNLLTVFVSSPQVLGSRIYKESARGNATNEAITVTRTLAVICRSPARKFERLGRTCVQLQYKTRMLLAMPAATGFL